MNERPQMSISEALAKLAAVEAERDEAMHQFRGEKRAAEANHDECKRLEKDRDSLRSRLASADKLLATGLSIIRHWVPLTPSGSWDDVRSFIASADAHLSNDTRATTKQGESL